MRCFVDQIGTIYNIGAPYDCDYIASTLVKEKEFKIEISSDELLIQSFESALLGSDFYIFNILGQKVQTAKIESSDQKIYLQNLTQGLYILKLQGKNNFVFTQNFIR